MSIFHHVHSKKHCKMKCLKAIGQKHAKQKKHWKKMCKYEIWFSNTNCPSRQIRSFLSKYWNSDWRKLLGIKYHRFVSAVCTADFNAKLLELQYLDCYQIPKLLILNINVQCVINSFLFKKLASDCISVQSAPYNL